MLSNRKPHQTPQFGEVQTKPIHKSFLTHERYAFDITLNPTKREQNKCDKQAGKVVAIKGHNDITAWFIARAPQSWGFAVTAEHLQVGKVSVQVFEKEGRTVTHGSATLTGELIVADRDRFIQSFTCGIGRGRAFGFGLLQIVPL
jgi:CRISPR system Cascade subunit CasE